MRNTVFTRFTKFIRDQELFRPMDRVILAVSGGIDSVVMSHLFFRADFDFAIAHCNFQLRGAESEADEKFVQDLAEEFGVPFFTRKFDTLAYSEKQGISIQMAARDLRYEWFDTLLAEKKYDAVATAHHKDDLAETVILNLIKGSVLKGLHGIRPKTEHVIRPILWASKEEILDYANFRDMEYREDKSNAQNKYQRNQIRNTIIPLLQKINPDLSETIYQASQRRYLIETWAEKQSEIIRQKIVNVFNDRIEIAISDLIANHLNSEIFFQWVEEFGIDFKQCEALFSNLESTETKVFYATRTISFINSTPYYNTNPDTDKYRMIKDKKVVIIEKYVEQVEKEAVIGEDLQDIKFSGKLFQFEIVDEIDLKSLKTEGMACLNAELLKFPLIIRRWQQGDSFKPFGMKGTKNLSDFLTDLKLNFLEKEGQLVLCSCDQICWVIGQRIDERYKIKPETKNILKVKVS